MCIVDLNRSYCYKGVRVKKIYFHIQGLKNTTTDFFFQKNPLQNLLSSLNAVILTNESTQFITGHVVYNLAYT